MRKTTLALLLGLLVAAPVALAAEDAAGPKWYADFDEAAKVAKAEGKDLLVDFTGSDWCGWCVRLHKEVFDQQAFKDAAKEKWVLVALDFPRAQELKDKVPNPERNQELQKQWYVRGFPTIFLMTADGEVFGRTGYQRGGPENYVKHLAELTKTGKEEVAKAGEMLKSFEAAEADEKVEIHAKAMEMFAGQPAGAPSPVAMKLLSIVKGGLTMDPKNESGVKAKTISALWDKGMADDALMKTAEEMDADNKLGFKERILEAGFQIRAKSKEEFLEKLKPQLEKVAAFEKLGVEKDKKRCMGIYANAAFCYFKHLDDKEKAIHFAKKVKAMGGDEDPKMKRLLDMILPKEEAPESGSSEME